MLVNIGEQNLPMAYLTLSTVMCIIGFQCPWIIIQFGWFVSWIYLRFYKKNTGDVTGGIVTYGDRSETFSLLSWFPPLVQYVHHTFPSNLTLLSTQQTPRPPWQHRLFTRQQTPPYTNYPWRC